MSADNHGNTPAAWTGFALGMLGFVIGTIALMRNPVSLTWFWVGVAVTAGAFVVFLVMDRIGYGDPR